MKPDPLNLPSPPCCRGGGHPGVLLAGGIPASLLREERLYWMKGSKTPSLPVPSQQGRVLEESPSGRGVQRHSPAHSGR